MQPALFFNPGPFPGLPGPAVGPGGPKIGREIRSRIYLAILPKAFPAGVLFATLGFLIQSPQPFGMVLGAAGAAQTPNIGNCRPTQKPSIKNTSVLCYRSCQGLVNAYLQTPTLDVCSFYPFFMNLFDLLGPWLGHGQATAPINPKKSLKKR